VFLEKRPLLLKSKNKQRRGDTIPEVSRSFKKLKKRRSIERVLKEKVKNKKT
jgi:hypothetical protein